jgi:glycosyltransferase involved in cell wall biosynthesis
LEKGHQFLLRAAAAVIKARPETNFLIIGTGPLRKQLESMSRALGLNNKVVFAGFYEDLNDVLAAMDIFVQSSRTESLPVAVIEAMAAGKPIVATAVGGISEAIEPDKTGIIVPPLDSSQMADAILSLLNNRKKAAQMGRRARQVVAEKFSVQDASRQIAQIYLRVMNSHTGKSRSRKSRNDEPL